MTTVLYVSLMWGNVLILCLFFLGLQNYSDNVLQVVKKNEKPKQKNDLTDKWINFMVFIVFHTEILTVQNCITISYMDKYGICFIDKNVTTVLFV